MNKVIIDIYNTIKKKFPENYPDKKIVKEIIDLYEEMLMETLINDNNE